MKPNFCIECTAPLTKKNDTDYICAEGHPFWNNPKAGVVAVFIKDGDLLFSRRAVEPNKGKYDFVGGFVNFGEDPCQAVIREVREETGATVTSPELFHAMPNRYIPGITTVDLFFIIKDWTGDFTPADDVSELCWKPAEFISGPEFAWSYPGLLDKVKAVIST